MEKRWETISGVAVRDPGREADMAPGAVSVAMAPRPRRATAMRGVFMVDGDREWVRIGQGVEEMLLRV